MSHKWLVVRLEAPLIAFGGVAVDQEGPTRDFPAASMLTGLAANAFGLHWSDRAAHQALQDRLIFAVRREREPRAAGVVTDVQNVQLSKADKGWTTFGVPEGRDGASYGAPHRRTRQYLADQAVRVVLRFDPADRNPTLEALAEALDRPARPLFIGRKPCLPSCRLVDGWVDGETAHEASVRTLGLGDSPGVVARRRGAGGRRRGRTRHRSRRRAELADGTARRVAAGRGRTCEGSGFMTPLFLIRVPVAMDKLARCAGERGWLRYRGQVAGFDEGRALHHLLDETFGPGALRPFRLLVAGRQAVGSLYGLL